TRKSRTAAIGAREPATIFIPVGTAIVVPCGRRPKEGRGWVLHTSKRRKERHESGVRRHCCRRGSSRSRRPSPSRLAPSTTSEIAIPGTVASHHAFDR